MDTSKQHQTAPESIVEDTGDATGYRSQAAAEPLDSVGMGPQGSTTTAAANAQDISAESKILLLEQQLEVAKEQSQKHEEHGRYLSHLAPFLSLLMQSGLLSDLTLQI